MNTTNNLDPQQLAAVDSDAQTIMCVASAGSGKTRTLIARIQRLIRDGVEPAKIAAVTYTNAGAKVMQERLPGVRLGFIGTLHSLSLRMLQAHGKLIGLPSTVTVLDAAAAALLLEQCRERLRVKCTAKELETELANVRAGGIGPHPSKPQLVVNEYVQTMRREGTLDFEAILSYMHELMEAYHEDVVAFDYLFCDEMQDAADVDWNIYDAMGVEHSFWVGDDSQSIYGFRGSNVKRFISMSQKFDVMLMPLATNYRCATSIITAANNLIQHNRSRIPNEARPRDVAPTGSVEVKEFSNANAELAWIANKLASLTRIADSPPSIAILWRTNNLANSCAEYLKALGVKVAETQRPAADNPEAKQGKALLRCLQDPFSDSAALHLLELTAGKERTDKLRAECARELVSVSSKLPSCFKQWQNGTDGFTAAAFQVMMQDIPIPGNGRLWIASLAKTVPEPFSIGDLMLAASRPEATVADTGGVEILTCHSAKGREWDVVCIGSMEAECWENKSEDENHEDERRLAYTAMTRARERLILTWCRERQNPFKRWLMDKRTPSRFLKEIAS